MATDIAVSETKRELADVAVQVLRRSVMIDPVQPALEQREDALDAIRGHVTPDILARA